MDRRSFLLGAISVPPILSFLSAGIAIAGDTTETSFMQVSRVLMGRNDLSLDVGNRIETLLQQRITGYAQKMAALARALAPATKDLKLRNQLLKSLSAADTELALDVAKPWYLGYVGTPSGTMFNNDATFVTYLDAQAYELVLKDLPRTSYPPGGQGWWQAVPDGVTSPAMPDRVTDWTWQPDGATGEISPPDPAWRAYGMGEYPSIEAARAAMPRSKPAPHSGTTAGNATPTTTRS